jgi:VIT1/CCC1 family predicted Fe2+/Mn2+ transporter
MSEKLNQLSFIIGVFFILVALVLLIGYAATSTLKHSINLYTGIAMMVFGLVMTRLKA